MTYQHQPVLLDEVLHYLKPSTNQNFIDCTLGGGGHTTAILNKISPKGKVLGIDLDLTAIEATKIKIGDSIQNKRLITAKGNFNKIKDIANVYKFNKVNGILLDLGLSSGQLQDQKRGFSFLADGRLDMRFGSQNDLDASKILNFYSKNDLAEIFRKYGEERLAGLIAQKIVEIRKTSPFVLPKQLVEVIADIYKRSYRGKSKINPATKVFQALRIAVNGELENLQQVLPQAVKLLTGSGRIAVISYHSLEDRIVKEFFRQESRDCICPPTLPICQCGHKKTLRIITKKPVMASHDEMLQNPRSRSAKLRVAEKI